MANNQSYLAESQVAVQLNLEISHHAVIAHIVHGSRAHKTVFDLQLIDFERFKKPRHFLLQN
jgi:hypothetical protein